MASSVAKIYQQLLAIKNSLSQLAALNSSSQVSIWNLWLWNTASGQAVFEQLSDQFQTNIETIIAQAPVFTLPWIAMICRNFQYSPTAPQVVQLNISNNYPFLSISYPTINTALQIITQAAAINNNNGQIIIKVASNSAPLNSAQLSALTSYLLTMLTPDTNFVLVSDNADSLYCGAQIYYNAAYSGIINASVQAAINNYLQSIPFNGIVTVSALEEAILAVLGVTDVVLNNVYARQATDPVPIGGPPPTNMLNILTNNNQIINRNYQTFAGYIIPETTSGYTLNDSLTFIAA